jgi:catechol 2,3-dioxygenase-like lactoylglutathione lyase family enzyme
MRPIQAVVETAIYVDDLDRAEAFYHGVLGLTVLAKEAGHHVFFSLGSGVLLAFVPDSTLKGERLPAHGSRGPGHFALGIDAADLDAWRTRLKEQTVPVEMETTWPLGGRSLYFRDPAGNLVELVTPEIWGLPSGW